MFLTDPITAQSMVRARRERYEREAAQSRLVKMARNPTERGASARVPTPKTANSCATMMACCAEAQP